MASSIRAVSNWYHDTNPTPRRKTPAGIAIKNLPAPIGSRKTHRMARRIHAATWRRARLRLIRIKMGSFDPEPNPETSPTGPDNEPAPPPAGWVWRQPARLSARRNHLSLRAPSKSGGLAKGAWGLLKTGYAKHTQPTIQTRSLSAKRPPARPHNPSSPPSIGLFPPQTAQAHNDTPKPLKTHLKPLLETARKPAVHSRIPP